MSIDATLPAVLSEIVRVSGDRLEGPQVDRITGAVNEIDRLVGDCIARKGRWHLQRISQLTCTSGPRVTLISIRVVGTLSCDKTRNRESRLSALELGRGWLLAEPGRTVAHAPGR
jgi:hypothetical protein